MVGISYIYSSSYSASFGVSFMGFNQLHNSFSLGHLPLGKAGHEEKQVSPNEIGIVKAKVTGRRGGDRFNKAMPIHNQHTGRAHLREGVVHRIVLS